MNSNFLNNFGLGNIDLGLVIFILLILIIITFIVALVSIINIVKLKKKYSKFMNGKGAKSLEEEIIRMFDDNREIKKDIRSNSKDIRDLKSQIIKTFQKMGLVRYDAYSHMGGKLSFCLALLDDNNDGFLLNSVQRTDSSYSYIKKIESGSCKLEMSDEEKLALNKALHGEEYEVN